MATFNFKNLATGEEMSVSNLSILNGRIFFSVRGKGCGQRFFNRNICLTLDEQVETGTFLTVASGWEMVSEPRHKTPKAEPKEELPRSPQPEENEEPQAIPEATEEHDELDAEVARMAISAKYGAMGVDIFDQIIKFMPKGGSNVNKGEVQDIINARLEELAAKAPDTYKKIEIAQKYEAGDDSTDFVEMVKAMVVNDRVIGRYPWLYGPAGSGKSTIARKVADELGLPFYSVSTILQKYELEGYTDAVGKLVETTCYKAFLNGGIFCFDEASTSSPEAQVAFNTMAAQLVYNFPGVGMVEAHPDFHIIACDNTIGRGQDSKYTARYQMDASTLDRYTFVEVAYSESHDLNMAQGDKELVEFIRAMRSVLDDSNSTYLATPRASKAIKAMQAMGMNDKDALWYGLCSGWEKQDIRTFAQRLHGYNRYFRAFDTIVESL